MKRVDAMAVRGGVQNVGLDLELDAGHKQL